MESDVNDRLADLERRIALVEARLTKSSPADGKVVALVRDFLLLHCEEVDEREEATWAADLFAWFAAWLSREKNEEVFAAVVFYRALRQLHTRHRSWQIKRADEQKNGVVYMVRPTEELRNKHASFVVACLPPPDVKQSGAITLRKVREYANRRLRVHD